MGIGTSQGAFYEDSFHAAAAGWDDKYDDNVIHPSTRPDDSGNDANHIDAVQKTPDFITQVGYNMYTKEDTKFDTQLGIEGMPSYDQYDNWVREQSINVGRDLRKDTKDYDLQGFYRDYPDTELNKDKHLTDEYKKPNHPTFSDESVYHGFYDIDGNGKEKTYEGGHWGKDEGKDTFTPGKTNLEEHSTKDLIDYFKRVEPDAKLILPGQ